MLRPLLVVMLAPLIRAAIVADTPTLSDRLEQLYEKLEKFTPTHPPQTGNPERLVKPYKKVERFRAPQTERPMEKILEKLDRLNSLTPERNFSDDDEELMDAMQEEWGMSDDQMDMLMKMQRKYYGEDYGDWNDEDQDLIEDDYPMDGSEDIGPDDEETQDSLGSTTTKILKMAFALNRLEPSATTTAALDPIAATKERPTIVDDSNLSKAERLQIRKKAFADIEAFRKDSKCLMPQPRWLSVRQLAPHADTVYLPPCVKLHRCAADSGCCSEASICAPADGHYVSLPLFLDKVGHGRTLARMKFFNHTRCECVPRDSLKKLRVAPPRRVTTVRPPTTSTRTIQQTTVQDSVRSTSLEDLTTQEPKPDNETTAPPQLKRCTCPSLFMARVSDAGCACVCDWADPARNRDCLSLARGREHFGMRDRVCVAHGSCNPPVCVFGTYEKKLGRCPLRRVQSGGSDAILDHPGDGIRTVTNLKFGL